MQDIVEEGYAPEDGNRCGDLVEGAFGDGEEEEAWSQCHQDIQQGGRIFRDIDKGQDGIEGVMLGGPGVGVTVDVYCSDEDEASDGAEAEGAEDLFSAGGVDFRCIELTQAVAEADDAE